MGIRSSSRIRIVRSDHGGMAPVSSAPGIAEPPSLAVKLMTDTNLFSKAAIHWSYMNEKVVVRISTDEVKEIFNHLQSAARKGLKTTNYINLTPDFDASLVELHANRDPIEQRVPEIDIRLWDRNLKDYFACLYIDNVGDGGADVVLQRHPYDTGRGLSEKEYMPLLKNVQLQLVKILDAENRLSRSS